ncbi:MAG: energy transducer TonB [Melioribacteraceae bacterium]|nr:energy transducer TonB [Melioribacteraceae bacterium]
MFWKNSEYQSAAISVIVHLLILIVLMAFSFSPEYDNTEYVTIGFGTIGETSSSGAITKKEPKREVKKKEKVEVPKVKNSDETNEVTSPPKKKKVVKEVVKKKESSKGREVSGEGEGKFGFELDFGGKGKRKIYSYSIPAYPSGVSKEIDVKLKFTIMPDGSVGRIFPIRKADTRLEAAAINSLRQWRFEALPSGQELKPQSAVITFPFRLQ